MFEFEGNAREGNAYVHNEDDESGTDCEETVMMMMMMMMIMRNLI